MHGHYPSCPGPSGCQCETTRLWRVFNIAAAAFFIQVAGAKLSESLALWADTAHLLVDNAAIIATIAATYLARAYPVKKDAIWEAGFKANLLLLAVAAGWILYEAGERFFDPRPVQGVIMTAAALIGGFCNFIQHRILEGAAHEHKHDAHASLSVHVFSDFIQSVGVVVGGIVIALTGWFIVDPAISVAISFWILWQIRRLWRQRKSGHAHRHR